MQPNPIHIDKIIIYQHLTSKLKHNGFKVLLALAVAEPAWGLGHQPVLLLVAAVVLVGLVVPGVAWQTGQAEVDQQTVQVEAVQQTAEVEAVQQTVQVGADRHIVQLEPDQLDEAVRQIVVVAALGTVAVAAVEDTQAAG